MTVYPSPTTATTSATVKEVAITASNFSYNVTNILATKGDSVRITLDNTQGMHDLTIEGYNIATQKLTAGQKETIEFVASKIGEFEYYCSIGNHRQMGMKGTLTVK